LIGLGGGLFSMYLHEAFSSLHLDCVELDPEIVRVASNHFGFKADSERLSVYVMVRDCTGCPCLNQIHFESQFIAL
jgi:spermidine synthase